MPIPKLPDLAGEYRRLFRELTVRPGWAASLERQANRIVARRARYEAVAARMPNNLPWFAIALLHSLEGDLDFETHLHNGDPLRARTVHIPRGRPVTGVPPFTWEESALDALRYDGWHKVGSPTGGVGSTTGGVGSTTGGTAAPTSVGSPTGGGWTLPVLLYQLESYNGWGTRARGVRTPYLWSGSQHYTAGKYVADGVWSATAVSQQLGAAVLLHALRARGATGHFEF